MSCLVKYVSENHQRLISTFRWFGLESPKRPFYYETGASIRFAGWIIAKPDMQVFFVVRLNDEVIATHYLNIDRRDVALAYRLDEGHANYGYDFQLTEGEFSKVEISIGGVTFDIWRVEYVNSADNALHNNLKEIWLNLHQNRKALAAEKFKLHDIDEQVVSSFFSNFLIVSNTDQVIARIKELDADKAVSLPRINQLIKELSNPYWSIDAIDQAATRKTLRVTSIFGNDSAVCVGCIAMDDINYLIFRDGDDIFYVTQYCAVVSVIFPSYLLLLGLSVPSDWVNLSRKKLSGVFQTLLRAYLDKVSIGFTDEAHFIGTNVSHARPYHYLYDYLYGLQVLSKRISKLPDSYSIKGFDFFNISGIFNNNSVWFSLDCGELNSKLLKRREFLISPCVQFCKTNDKELLASLSEKLVAHSEGICKHDSELQNKITRIGGCYPMIWFGISTEKRSWVEQVDGFGAIVDKLKKIYPNICIFIDGRTFPVNPVAADHNHKNREDVIFQALVAINPDVKHISLIGCTASEKIYFANKCDFFIASYGTDSIYPSNVCRKPGIVYSPRAIGDQRSLHVHHNVLEIPEEHVRDSAQQGGDMPWYQISVSIDWQIIFDLIIQLMDEKLHGNTHRHLTNANAK